MAKYKAPETNDSPDLTPMIDVVFLLIVFFMVVAQQMSEQYVELGKMAIAGNAKVKENPPPRTIFSLDDTPAGQKLYWGEQEIVNEQIATIINKYPKQKVLLRVHADIEQAVTQEILKVIMSAGKAEVVLNLNKK